MGKFKDARQKVTAAFKGERHKQPSEPLQSGLSGPAYEPLGLSEINTSSRVSTSPVHPISLEEAAGPDVDATQPSQQIPNIYSEYTHRRHTSATPDPSNHQPFLGHERSLAPVPAPASDRYRNRWDRTASFLKTDAEMPETPALRQSGSYPMNGRRDRYELPGQSGHPNAMQAKAGATAAWPTTAKPRTPAQNLSARPAMTSTASTMPVPGEDPARSRSRVQGVGNPYTFLDSQGPPDPSHQPGIDHRAPEMPQSSIPYAPFENKGLMNHPDSAEFLTPKNEANLDQASDSGLHQDHPLPPIPSQNEGRRRTEKVHDSGAHEAAVSRSSHPQAPQPAPLPAPVINPAEPGIGGLEARIRTFLRKHDVLEENAGQDWLGTLTLWATTTIDESRSRCQQLLRDLKHKDAALEEVRGHHVESQRLLREAASDLATTETQLKKAEQDLQEEKKLAAEQGHDIRTLNWQLSSQTSQLAEARRSAADWKKKGLAADSMRHDAEVVRDEFQRKLREAQESLNGTRLELQTVSSLAGDTRIRLDDVERRLQSANATLADSNTRLDSERKANARLRQETEEKSRQIASHLAQVQSLNTELEGIGETHQHELRDQASQHQRKLGIQASQHQNQVQELHNRMAQLIDQHEQDLKVQEDRLIARTRQLETDLAVLQGQVDSKVQEATKHSRETIDKQNRQIASYSKSADYTPIEDAVFSRTFKTLIIEVNQLASRIALPRRLDFDRSLDPTDCLARNAAQRAWIWPRFVRSLCWQILLGGFFSQQLGFGAFGAYGEGHSKLNDMLELMAQGRPGGTSDAAAVVPNNKKTNAVRANLFESILATIRSDPSQQNRLSAFFSENVNNVVLELQNAIGHIMNDHVDEPWLRQANDVTRKLGMLALEMGTQRARVMLEVCRFQESPASDGWSTEDADAMGPTVRADLMLHPCLIRVGDGVEQLHSKKVIVKGEFVPLRSFPRSH